MSNAPHQKFVSYHFQELLSLLTPRDRSAHKGAFGHVLIIGGDEGMPGSVRLAAEAAARTGAGLVSVATRRMHVPSVVASRPEVMCHGVEQTEDLTSLLARATALVIGPGLGRGDWGKTLWQSVWQIALPKIIDADALYFLAKETNLNLANQQWILTPHPGEAAILLETTADEIQKDRVAAVQKIQQRYGGVAILKGAGTLVTSASGEIWRCEAGNPGMASGGMGDVLSGIISSLLAQGMVAEQASRLAVALHAHAADEAAKDGERGLLASDLMYYLRYFINRVDERPRLAEKRYGFR